MYKFGKQDPVKEYDKQKIIENARKATDDAIVAAQNCLKTETFLKYRLEYENLEKLLINQMMFIDEVETDPVCYGFQMKDIVGKLRHLGALLRGVNADADRT